MKFFKKLLSGSDDVSTKRVAALLSLSTLIAIIILATLKDDNYIPPQFMYDALSLLTASALGLSVSEKIFAKKINAKPPPDKQNINNDPEIPSL